MERVGKVILYIVVLILAIGLLIFGARTYNDFKFEIKDSNIAEFYKDVTNIDLYPKSVDGVDIKYVDSKAMQGFHFITNNKLHNGVVICYGGSEGSPNFEEAQRLAEEGYETLAVFLFGMKHQPKTLVRVPLEQFEDVLNYVDENIPGNGPITVLGASKGAEYALNLAGKYDRISNLILKAPSAYNFSGLDFDNYGSSWTWEHKELPYIDIKKSSFPNFIKNVLIPMIVKSPVQFKETYSTAIDKDFESYTKLIPVKELKTNILLIAGEDDKMWDSAGMANIIKLQNDNVKIAKYKGAGHIFAGDGILNTVDMRMKVGGTLEANNEAAEESNKEIDDFLRQYHN